MKKYRPLHELDPRYSESWSANSKWGRAQTNHICCHCWLRKAQEWHHTRYLVPTFFGGSKRVKDDERGYAGRFLFPLCDRCHHGIMHSSRYWIKGKTTWHNHQSAWMEWRLRWRYALLRLAVMTWFVWMPLLAGFTAYVIGLTLKVAN